MLLRVVLVALGGAVGSVLRYLIGVALAAWTHEGRFPIATLVVNVVGSFALGLVLTASPEPSALRLAVTTGLLGGFTTYSAFNHETWELLRHGHGATGVAYVVATVGSALLAGALGARLGASFAR